MKRINCTLGLLSVLIFMIAACSKAETPQPTATQPDAAPAAVKDAAAQTTATPAAAAAPVTTVTPTMADTSTTATAAAADTTSATTATVAQKPQAPPDFDAKTSVTTNFNGQFIARNLRFEARDVVINLKMTVDCLNEVKGNRYSVFVHVVKDGKAVIGMGPLDLVTEKRQLRQGEKQELNFLTQLSAKFDPAKVDGIRFGVLQVSDDGQKQGRLPIIESKFPLEDGKSAAFWSFK